MPIPSRCTFSLPPLPTPPIPIPLPPGVSTVIAAAIKAAIDAVANVPLVPKCPLD